MWKTVFACWLVCMSALVQAGEVDPAKAPAKLTQFLNGIQSMEAGFEQWVMDAKQNALQHVTGSMWIQRPGQFRWNADEPYPQQIASDGKELWIYDSDLEQATRKALDKEVGNTPALLLSGDPSKISDGFVVTAYRFDETGEWRFDLKPKDKDALFALLRVHFLNDKLRDMYLEDNLGQTTRIEFKTKQLNKPIPASRFKLNLPDGVDVIGED